MPRYELQKIPGSPIERGNFDCSLIDFLNRNDVHGSCIIRVNGKDLPDDYDMDQQLSVFDFVQVYDQPRGGIGKVISSIIKPVTKVLSTALSLLGMSAKSASVSTSSESSNNDLTQQTNRARLYKGRPNIYGQVRAYPDLIQESLLQYIDQEQYATEWMELGYGHYNVTSVRFSESTLTSLAGASYKIYQPGDVIPLIEQGYAFDDVSDQELEGPDEATSEIIQQATSNEIQSASFGGGEVLFVITENNDFDYFNDSAKPLGVTVKANVTYSSASGSVTKDITFSANIYSSEVVDITDDTTGVITGHNMKFLLNNLSGSDISVLPTDTQINKTSVTFIKYATIKQGPFFAPFSANQLWLNLYASLGENKNADVLVTYWLIDDDNNQISGTEKTIKTRLEGKNDDTSYAYQTLKITDIGDGRAAFTIERTDDGNGSTLNIKSALAITIRENVVYPNDTIIRVDIRQTDSQANNERKYNCLAQRLVYGYNRETGGVITTLAASRSFADAVLHEWLAMCKQEISRLDLESLYSIADSLSDPQLGYFDYTFSDATQTLGDRLQIICNAANVSFNWIGGKLVFWRDEKVDYPDAVFARSNMFWDNFKRSYSPSLTGGYDGVSVTYTDPTTNKSAYVYLSVDENGVTVAADETNNSNKITLNGCRNVTQATQRAWQEARAMIYSRSTMTVNVLESVQVVRGSVVQCPDMYDNDQQTGYLTARNGNVFSTSEKIKFGSDQLYVVMTDSDGNYQGRWAANAVSGNSKAFYAEADQFSINLWDGVNIQSPSRYFIASDSDLNSSLWRVNTAKPNGDETQTLTLSEYSESIYE